MSDRNRPSHHVQSRPIDSAQRFLQSSTLRPRLRFESLQIRQDLRGKRVRALIYNAQAVSKLTERMLALAKQAQVPAVRVTETEPAGQTYQQWMSGQIDLLAKALGDSQP